METTVHIPMVGELFAQSEADGSVYCYSTRVPFKGSRPELIIYPRPVLSPLSPPLSDAQKEAAGLRFQKLQDGVDAALRDLPGMLRRLCRDYGIKVRLRDDELRDGLTWENVKLDPDGDIECYTRNERLTKTFDIVLVFSPDVRLVSVYFDG